MAVLLSDIQKSVQDHLTGQVIDEFRRSSYLLDTLPFDDAVNPSGGGSTMTYAYTRVMTPAAAAVREINAEYTPQEAKKERYAVDLKVFGGAFEIDRVLAGMGGVANEVTFQMGQKIKAAQALFSDLVINGDSSANMAEFDGLDMALTGSSTEMTAGQIDLSTTGSVTDNYMALVDMLDEFITLLDGTPTCLLGNTAIMTKLRACARRAAMYQITQDNWGRRVECYGDIPLIDLGAKPGSADPVIGMDAGVTSLYAVRMGLDGFHAVTVQGQSPVKTYLPDFTSAGAVKRGEVEMVAAVALKATRAAAVLRDIKVK